MGDELVRRQVTYQGRVQGVGFRNTAASIARGHPDVTGTVRNLADGRVEVQVQGARAVVELYCSELESVMKRHITGRDVIPAAIVPGEAGFLILR
jgi:acylphosphatase